MRRCRICGLILLFLLLTSHVIHAYERDVHYDLTKYLARWAGFSEADAEQIAAADQELDTKSEFNPLPNLPQFCPQALRLAVAAPTPAIIQAACKDDPEFQRMLTAQRAYHFADGKRLQELRDAAFRGKNLKTLGHYLHVMQDTFAHSLMDYKDLPPMDKLVASLGFMPDEKIIGHFLYGHSVDKTYERPDLAEHMARYVYAEMVRFSGSTNRWNEVEAAVVRFANAKDLDKKLRYLSAPSPPSPPVASSQPLGLPTTPQEPMHEGRTFIEWQADLRDPSPAVREKAALALGHFGPKAVPILTQTVRDSDPNVRWAAADALGDIGPAAKDAVPALVQALKDLEAFVRTRASTALRQIAPGDVREWELAEWAAADERARQREEAAQRQANQQRESCRKLRNRSGGLLGNAKPCSESADEEKKATADKIATSFKAEYGIQQMVEDCHTLTKNPFPYEGKTVGLYVIFSEMATRHIGILYAAHRTHGVYDVDVGCRFEVSGIPEGTFDEVAQRRPDWPVVLAAKVLGRSGPFPHLQFVGIYVCKYYGCADFFGPASMR